LAAAAECVRTDSAGRFTVHNLRKGPVRLSFRYNKHVAVENALASGSPDELKVRLRPTADVNRQERPPSPRAIPA
jgi:hypothetical protein